jgi:hypothetical protein
MASNGFSNRRGDSETFLDVFFPENWPMKTIYLTVLAGYAMTVITQRTNLVLWTFTAGAASSPCSMSPVAADIPYISDARHNFLNGSATRKSNVGWYDDFLRHQQTGHNNQNITGKFPANMTAALLIPPVLRRVGGSCNGDDPHAHGSVQTRVTDTVHSMLALANNMAQEGHFVLLVAPFLDADNCGLCPTKTKSSGKHSTSDAENRNNIQQALLEALVIENHDRVHIYAVPVTCDDFRRYEACRGIGNLDVMRHLKFPFAGKMQNILCSTLPLYSAMWTPITRLGHAVLKQNGKNVPAISHKQRRLDAEQDKHRISFKNNADAKIVADNIDLFVVPQDFLPGVLMAEKLCIPTIMLASSSSISLLVADVSSTNNGTTTLQRTWINAKEDFAHNSTMRSLQNRRRGPPSWVAAPGSGVRRPSYWFEYVSNILQQRLINFRFGLAYVSINKVSIEDTHPRVALASFLL